MPSVYMPHFLKIFINEKSCLKYIIFLPPCAILFQTLILLTNGNNYFFPQHFICCIIKTLNNVSKLSDWSRFIKLNSVCVNMIEKQVFLQIVAED